MPGDVSAFKRTYGLAAVVLLALTAVAVGAMAFTDAMVEAAAVLAVTASSTAAVLGVGAVHRPRAFLTVFGDADAAERERVVLATRVSGVFAVAVSLVLAVAGIESLLAYRDLATTATAIP
ncbi:hypothetical protein [Halorubellus litoreus]|uniref:Uncharacterized protein n=1 Tax=Halorubellus litoreus TaxID=755308 RepID=A0ABD5VBS6_9EURY